MADRDFLGMLRREASTATPERRSQIGAQMTAFCTPESRDYSRSVHLDVMRGELILWRNALARFDKRLTALACKLFASK